MNGTWHGYLIAIVSLYTLAGVPTTNAEEYIKNGDFSNGKSHWQHSGEIVYLDTAGNKVDKDAGGKPALQLTLINNRFTVTDQTFRTKDKLGEITVTVKVKASADYKRNDSTDYASVNFKPGGIYYWSAIVYPKADFFIRLTDNTHLYSLADLSPGQEKTITARFNDLGAGVRERTLFLNAAPGDGSIYVESVSVN
jgi:hypothetical protein